MTWMLQEKHAADLVCHRAAAVLHRRSQDFFFWGVHFFCSKRLKTFFTRRPQYTWPKLLNQPLPRSNSPRPAKISSQIWLVGALATYPYRSRPKNFTQPWGMHVHPVHPLATPVLCWKHEIFRVWHRPNDTTARWPDHRAPSSGNDCNDT